MSTGSGGGARPKQTSWPLTSLAPWHIGGSPFTVHGKVCHPEPGVWPSPQRKDEGGRGKGSGGSKGKAKVKQEEVDGGGILEEGFPASWIGWMAIP